MITIEFRLCGFGLKRRWEFGDPRRSPIVVLELGLLKICKMRGDSKFVEFMRGYCDNSEFGWHPKVRLARRKAEKKAQAQADKNWKERHNWLLEHANNAERKASKLQTEKSALLKTIELKREDSVKHLTR
ncbi:hypothetical protein [Acinetobacter entericus]|uniref:Uncharacterized protein n=1 Tax=Acinetobacter entericus TaxID=2989714 RepID=A0ABT3NP71_9GAMM|nr:hypothetical protein [Acinetobacter entericus]MCW8041359.1 hypothetical protein [Acinetobacter entericus]